ncbi:hypothetical protein SLS60_006277 [Paraconiothyrium brasiliense]|uniref:DUF155 domain-containing protein n=1 Tax=Paraconiothyrium brasiliense TaxID=300254 RepID=A0ABR3REI5_9PLEO
MNYSARSFASASRTLLHRVPGILEHRPVWYPARFYRSTAPSYKKIDSAQKQGLEAEVTTKGENNTETQKTYQRGTKKHAGKTSSLRRVAVEAQRSRQRFVKGRGSKRFVDPHVDTKTVTAYCAAETYNISTAARLVKAQGYELDPLQTGLYPQVIHIQTRDRPSEVKDSQEGDIFIFPSGTMVTWNVREREALHLVNRILPAAAECSHLDLLETEDLEYLEDPTRESSEVLGDTIILGTKAEQGSQDAPKEPIVEETEQRHEIDTVLAKIAFSSGLARSTKLAILETLLSSYQDSTRDIPIMLAKGDTKTLGRKNVPFTRSFILRKTGELLNIRAQLNLYSELTDSMPDIFWDSRHELGLGEYYDQVGRALDVGVRIRVLNEKIGFAQEIASVLRESLSEKHGLRLEWAIIALIAVEVVLEFYRHWTDAEERKDPRGTESLLRQYLIKIVDGPK